MLKNFFTYPQVYMNWMNFLVNVMIPLGILLYMNIAIYKGMKKLHGSPIIATSGANGSILQDTQMKALRYLGLKEYCSAS